MSQQEITDQQQAHIYMRAAQVILQRYGDAQAVVSLAKEAALLDRSPPALCQLGAVLYEADREQEAVDNFKEALKIIESQDKEHRDTPLSKTIEAHCLSHLDRQEEALELYRQVTVMAPGHEDATKNYQMAEERLQKKTKVNASFPPLPETYMNKEQIKSLLKDYKKLAGDIMGDFKDYDATVSLRERILVLEPESAKNHFDLAATYQDMDRHDEARKHFQKAVELSPDKPFYRYELAESYMEIGRYPEASEELKKALETIRQDAMSGYKHSPLLVNVNTGHLGPDIQDPAMYLNALGVAMIMQKDYDEAEKYLRQALAIGPDHVVFLNNMAHVLIETGRKDNAAEYLEHALQIEPDNEACLHNLKIAQGKTVSESQKKSESKAKVPSEFQAPKKVM